MGGIAAQQVRKIYAIGNTLGIVEHGNKLDDLHALVNSVTGKESVKKLTYNEADSVIAELQRRQGGNIPTKRRMKTHNSVAGGITEGQQRKVWALMYDLKKLDREPNTASLGDRLCGIIKRELKVDAKAENPFVWIDFKIGNKLIEILKKYIDSTKRKAGEKNV